MKIRFKKGLIAATAGLTAYCGVVLADTGGLRITVTDSTGNSVSGAEVTVRSPESLGSRDGRTDENGEFKAIGLDPSAKYIIEINGDGYQPIKSQDVLVVSDQNFALNYTLNSASDSIEEVLVMGRPVQLIDSSSTIVGQDITLDLTESLPTGRSYQSYLQLAPSTKPSERGNPSSKSGVNYSDVPDRNGNADGQSSDNVYYIDGVNVTDNLTGTFGANFNSEIIQEQHVLTGGIPAEYEGGAGLVSRVVTKSGSNEFHGSVNYYTQSDSLVADNKHVEGEKFSTFDSAFTMGGPIIQDKLWFFTSYQIKEREDDVFYAQTGESLRTTKDEAEYGFAKLTWQATDVDRLTVEFFNDPTEISGSRDSNTLNNRDRIIEQGGDNYKLEYSHTWDDLILTLEAASHEGELSQISADRTTRNDVAFLGATTTQFDTDLGGRGSDTVDFRNKDTITLSLEYFLDTDWGSHTLKAGYTNTVNERKLHQSFTGEGAQYTSIGTAHSGTTFIDYINSSWTGAIDLTSQDNAEIIDAISESDDLSFFLGELDTDGNGAISENEVNALTFDSTEGNPNNMVNVYRVVEAEGTPIKFESRGDTFFIQDTWTYGQWAVNAGLRAEEWDHRGTDGSNIFTFDTEIAPRLGVTYDILGDGSSKVWGFYGRYYDPVRTNMTAFAGTFSGRLLDEQVFIGDRWLTFRSRGPGDAFFAPSTKTPYTDEYMLGYSQSLTDDMSIEFTYTDRVTEDILEDYNLGLYTDQEAAGDFALPISYFGYDSIPDSNFVIATLAGGKREYQGMEVAFRKRRSVDNWQMLASYTYNQAKGNSNSDSNADFQGDVIFLDPRAPNVWGDQPGNIEHLFKMAGTYFWDNGIELGITYRWNSGLLYSETRSASGRHLPIFGDEYEYGGVSQPWVFEGAVGSHKAPSYGVLDARLKYTYNFGDYDAEFFLDIFNVLDDQSVVREHDLSSPPGDAEFGDARDWVEPRRFYLGTRVSF